jgi:class 3 adenylate cyclase
MPETQQRKLAAIMFTDIVGYTAMMQEDQTRAVRTVKRHQEVLEEMTARYRGEVLNYYGDGSLSIFVGFPA